MRKEALKKKWERFIKDLRERWDRMTLQISKRRGKHAQLHRKLSVKKKHQRTQHQKGWTSMAKRKQPERFGRDIDEDNPRKRGQILGPERERHEDAPQKKAQSERKTQKFEREYFRGEEDLGHEDFPRRKVK